MDVKTLFLSQSLVESSREMLRCVTFNPNNGSEGNISTWQVDIIKVDFSNNHPYQKSCLVILLNSGN